MFPISLFHQELTHQIALAHTESGICTTVFTNSQWLVIFGKLSKSNIQIKCQTMWNSLLLEEGQVHCLLKNWAQAKPYPMSRGPLMQPCCYSKPHIQFIKFHSFSYQCFPHPGQWLSTSISHLTSQPYVSHTKSIKLLHIINFPTLGLCMRYSISSNGSLFFSIFWC